MYSILSFIVFLFSILFAVLFSGKMFEADRIWKIFITVLVFFSINTFSCIIGFYLSGNQMNRWVILGTCFAVLAVLMFILNRYRFSPIVINKHPNLYISFSVFLIFFFLLLISTNMEFLPVWGNVDEVHHFQMSVLMYNALSIENPLPYKGLEPLRDKFEIFSYLWGYHYNCALIAYIFHIDILHVAHILRSLSEAVVVAMPLLMIKNKSRWTIILYILLACFNYNSWYGFLNSGYSPNLFSMMICWIIICILCNTKNDVINSLEARMILPLAVIMGLASYLTTGIFLLLFIIYYYYCKNSLKRAGWILMWCILLIPQPAIWRQVELAFSGTGEINPAIADNVWMSEKPPVLWLLIATVVIILFLYQWLADRRQVKWEFLFFSVSVFVVFLYFFCGRSYIMYKVLIVNAILFVIYLCDYIVKAGEKIGNLWRRRIAICILSVCMVFLLHKGHIFNIVFPPFPLNEVRLEITKEGMDCLDYILNLDLEENCMVEYLGTDGTGAMFGNVILNKVPYSYEKVGGGSFHVKGTYTARKYVEAVLKGKCKEEKIIVWLDNDGLPDRNILECYAFLFHDVKELYKSGDCEVWEYNVDNEWKIWEYDIKYLKQSEGVECRNIHRYGESVVMAEKGKQTTIRFKVDDNKDIYFIDIGGRALNDSELIVRGVKEGKVVYEEKLEEFEGSCLHMLSGKVACDEIQLLATSIPFSDSVIINNIYIGGKEAVN